MKNTRKRTKKKAAKSPSLLHIHDTIASLPEHKLLGSTLLDRRARGEAITETELAAATREAIDYGRTCQLVLARLTSLRAIPAAIECPEYGL